MSTKPSTRKIWEPQIICCAEMKVTKCKEFGGQKVGIPGKRKRRPKREEREGGE